MNYDPLKLLRESAEFWIQNGDAKQKTREFIFGQLIQTPKISEAAVNQVLDEVFPVSKPNGHSTSEEVKFAEAAPDALKQLPVKTVPVENIVPPSEIEKELAEAHEAARADVDAMDVEEPATSEPITESEQIAELKAQVARAERVVAETLANAAEKVHAAKTEADDAFLREIEAKQNKRRKVDPKDAIRAAEITKRKLEEAQNAAFASLAKNVHEYPQFPSWVMNGTSIYENFVKPICATNERIDYFMWMPTAALLMNYLGTKVKVSFKSWKPSFYLVLIGEKDKAHKSSSIKDGMKFLECAGILSMYSKETKNADGKTLVWEAGSPEGLGTDMQRTNCKNAVLFYDELSSLVMKAHIEGSGMMGALLKLYESANFANSVKKKTEVFSVAPDSYVASVITATTDQRFQELWGQFAGEDTGLNTRFTFVLQPEQMPEDQLEQALSEQEIHEAAQKTKVFIDKAVNQGRYQFDYGFDGEAMLKECQKTCGGRTEIRAEKWALYFAVDLGREVIDSECIERGVALAMYETAVKKFLEPEEADSKLAGLQQKMARLLERTKGYSLPLSTFKAETGARKVGTEMWNKAFFGLVKDGVIEFEQKSIPQIVKLQAHWGAK